MLAALSGLLIPARRRVPGAELGQTEIAAASQAVLGESGGLSR